MQEKYLKKPHILQESLCWTKNKFMHHNLLVMNNFQFHRTAGMARIRRIFLSTNTVDARLSVNH